MAIPHPTITIRRATIDDASTLLGFILELVHETEGRRLDAGVVAKGLETALSDPAHRPYFIADVDGKVVADMHTERGGVPQTPERVPVGCCLITTEWSDWTGHWYWWFQSVFVVPEFRGAPHDVWPTMYEHVCSEALAAGVKTVKLYVYETNERAKRAYVKHGMEPSPYQMYEADV